LPSTALFAVAPSRAESRWRQPGRSARQLVYTPVGLSW
jgi:hypothetical protein